MKIIFMGTPEIAATCLQKLISEGRQIAAVYTKVDKPVGRSKKLTESPVKQLAKTHGIPVVQPESFKNDDVIEGIRELQPDLIIAVAYGKILPQSVLDIPKFGCINIHGSLLPELRGSGPVQWSILNHFDVTGVTAMYMAAEMDAGDIIEKRSLSIDPDETSGELMDRIAILGAELLNDTVTAIEQGTVVRVPQDAEKATYAPMLTKDLSPIDWSETARNIHDLVRGLQPWPVATCEIQGTKLKVHRVSVRCEEHGEKPGTILASTKKGLDIACADGIVTLCEVQADGGKRMSAADYFRGHPVEI